MINRAVGRSGSGLNSLALIWVLGSRLPWWGIAAVLNWSPPVSARLRSWLLASLPMSASLAWGVSWCRSADRRGREAKFYGSEKIALDIIEGVEVEAWRMLSSRVVMLDFG